MRILLDPTAPEGNGPAPAPAAPAPPATPAAPAAPQVVTIPWDQFQLFQQSATQVAEMRVAQQTAERDKAQALADKQAAEGRWEAAAKTLRDQHAAEVKAKADEAAGWEGRAKQFARDSALMADLAGRPLVPGAAGQLAKLIGSALEAHPDGAGFAVRTATYQDVKTFFDAELAKPEYAHFLKPSTQGGSGGGGSDRTTATPPAADPAAPNPRNLGEYLVQRIATASADRRKANPFQLN